MGFQGKRSEFHLTTSIMSREYLWCVLGGRPDVMKLIKEVYDVWKAEVVFITSNLQGNREMMEGCKEAGIPAFVCRPTVSACLRH